MAFFRVAFFRVAFFSGGFFPGGFFPGGLFMGGLFMGDFFMDGFFPGTIFQRYQSWQNFSDIKQPNYHGLAFVSHFKLQPLLFSGSGLCNLRAVCCNRILLRTFSDLLFYLIECNTGLAKSKICNYTIPITVFTPTKATIKKYFIILTK